MKYDVVLLRFLFSPKKVVVIFPSPKLARRQIGIHRHAIGAEPRGEFTIHFVEETHFLDKVLMNWGQVHHVEKPTVDASEIRRENQLRIGSGFLPVSFIYRV